MLMLRVAVADNGGAPLSTALIMQVYTCMLDSKSRAVFPFNCSCIFMLLRLTSNKQLDTVESSISPFSLESLSRNSPNKGIC